MARLSARICSTRFIGAIGGRCIGTIGVVHPGALFIGGQRALLCAPMNIGGKSEHWRGWALPYLEVRRSALHQRFLDANAREVSGRPKRCRLAHAVLREYSYERLQLAQLPGQRGVVLTQGRCSHFHASPCTLHSRCPIQTKPDGMRMACSARG
jgi:hypothetical protein